MIWGDEVTYPFFSPGIRSPLGRSFRKSIANQIAANSPQRDGSGYETTDKPFSINIFKT